MNTFRRKLAALLLGIKDDMELFDVTFKLDERHELYEKNEALEQHNRILKQQQQYYLEEAERLLEKNKELSNTFTKYQLTMAQLGTFLPNFESLSEKGDDFKNSLSLVCYNLTLAPQWSWLIDRLKQDQVNGYLFDPERKSEDFMRGTINGIYVVEEIIKERASAHQPKPNTKTTVEG